MAVQWQQHGAMQQLKAGGIFLALLVLKSTIEDRLRVCALRLTSQSPFVHVHLTIRRLIVGLDQITAQINSKVTVAALVFFTSCVALQRAF